MDPIINPAVATIMTYARGATLAKPIEIRSAADLCAVRRYLAEPSARSTFPRVANASDTWRQIVTFWDDICLIHDLEAPDWPARHSPAPQAMAMIKTYQPQDENNEDRES